MLTGGARSIYLTHTKHTRHVPSQVESDAGNGKIGLGAPTLEPSRGAAGQRKGAARQVRTGGERDKRGTLLLLFQGEYERGERPRCCGFDLHVCVFQGVLQHPTHFPEVPVQLHAEHQRNLRKDQERHFAQAGILVLCARPQLIQQLLPARAANTRGVRVGEGKRGIFG